MQMPGVARSLGATVRTFSLRQDTGWEPDWEEFERAVTSRTRLLYLSNPNNPTGSILSRGAMERIVSRCASTGTWILADEVYLGAEIAGERTTSFWGMSDRVIVTSGLSKAYGIRLRSDDENNQKIFSSLRSLNQHIQQLRAK